MSLDTLPNGIAKWFGPAQSDMRDGLFKPGNAGDTQTLCHYGKNQRDGGLFDTAICANNEIN